jgi:hypothetical protein
MLASTPIDAKGTNDKVGIAVMIGLAEVGEMLMPELVAVLFHQVRDVVKKRRELSESAGPSNKRDLVHSERSIEILVLGVSVKIH